MAYDINKWKKRMSQRSDMSSFLTHLTREVKDENGKTVMTLIDVLLKILNEGKIIGSDTNSGFIVGNNRAVCFQDAPLHGISQNVLHEQILSKEKKSKIRYRAAGILFTKPYLYKVGARPVIYEKTEIAKKIIDKEEWYRIVNLDFSDSDRMIDWTHEREWRLKGDFEFELQSATILLPNQHAYKNFIVKADPIILKQLNGIVTMNNIIY